MSYLPQYKIIRRCCICGAKDVPGRKVKKDEYCLSDYNNMKTSEQIGKAQKREQNNREKTKVRSLIGSVGNVEMVSRQNLIEDIDTVVSRIVRLRNADKEGRCKCYTCPKVDNWKQMQCGHYISRSHLALRFDTLWNTRVQCPSCNVGKHGNLEVYKENLEKEEPGITERLYEISKEVAQMGNDELKRLLDFKREQLRIIEDGIKQQKAEA